MLHQLFYALILTSLAADPCDSAKPGIAITELAKQPYFKRAAFIDYPIALSDDLVSANRGVADPKSGLLLEISSEQKVVSCKKIASWKSKIKPSKIPTLLSHPPVYEVKRVKNG
jgi:hypothetical protein